jgi:hypothetical protein
MAKLKESSIGCISDSTAMLNKVFIRELDNDERFEIKGIEYRERCASLRRQHPIGARYRVCNPAFDESSKQGFSQNALLQDLTLFDLIKK